VLSSGSRSQNIGGTGPAHAADLCVHVDPRPLELLMVGVDVVGLQADTGLALAHGTSRRRWRQRDRGRLVAKADLDPAVAVAEEPPSHPARVTSGLTFGSLRVGYTGSTRPAALP
jgi:hypothetical protein